MFSLHHHCALCLAATRHRPLCPLCQRLCCIDANETQIWETNYPFPVWSLGTFDSALKALVLQLKHGHDGLLGEWAGQAIAKHMPPRPKPDAVTWVPGQRLNRWIRGGDPASHIARGIARELNLPVRALLRPSLAWHGRHRSRSERKQGRFSVQTSNCRRVWLVDDVLVTGNTLQGAAQTLEAHGLTVEEVAVIARG